IALNDGVDVGGGICAERSSIAIAHSLVRGNSSPSMGGGMYVKSAGLAMTNSIVAQNHATIIGGGMYADSCWGNMTNNTLDRNRATYGGGNVYAGPTPSLNVNNNLVTYGGKNGFQAASMSNVVFRFNNSFGNTPVDVVSTPAPDTTNTSRNPLYADTTSFDYHLLVNSGGIDTGDPAGPADQDGSRGDQGAFGGSAGVMAAPAYAKNLSATAANDTTISLSWDALGGAASYTVYASATNNFLPGLSTFLATVSAPTTALLHRPVAGCRYYHVSGANAAGYGGGYSSLAAACASGPDLIPPSVTVVYPNGKEILQAGDTVRVDWHATDNRCVDSVSVYYSINAGRIYTRVAHGWRADSSYAWVVPSTLSDSCLVKVVAYDPGRLTGVDTSDSLFAIKARTGVHDPGDGDNNGTPRFVTALEQNFPNPFNGVTTIRYSIGERCDVVLGIYDPAGRAIRVLERTDRSPGRYSVFWNGKDGAGRDVASGVYFCRIKAGKFSQTRKILYLR
ncbi:MAG TPA: FlgD immunoglobulin-like domain containing protein, partial [Candidatus Bathyarchaeia archaeon]|nr:FlgD immunoglobulin-like domain containing protein [Candidatus Bathyarchaeia archaeon]